MIPADQLYTLGEGSGYGVHSLELDIPGLRAYTFTFW